MVQKHDLTDAAIRKLPPAAPGKRYFAWDAQVRGFGLRVTDKSHPDDPKKAGSLSFVLVTRYPGASSPAPRQLGDYPTMSLADARKRPREWLSDIEHGVDPKQKAEASRRAAEAA